MKNEKSAYADSSIVVPRGIEGAEAPPHHNSQRVRLK